MFAVFVDVGFLRAQGAKALKIPHAACRVDARKFIRYVRETYDPLLRTYWYDGQMPPRMGERYKRQKEAHDAIALTPGLVLRLGTIKQVTPLWMQRLERALSARDLSFETLGIQPYPVDVQKGVDVLLALDLVHVAQKHSATTLVLVSGDRDLLEAVRRAQDEGARVIVLYPGEHPEGKGAPVDYDLHRQADECSGIPLASLSTFLTTAASLT